MVHIQLYAHQLQHVLVLDLDVARECEWHLLSRHESLIAHHQRLLQEQPDDIKALSCLSLRQQHIPVLTDAAVGKHSVGRPPIHYNPLQGDVCI